MSKKTSSITYAQQGVYIECVIDPESINYNYPKIVHIPSGIAPDAVAEAVGKVLECHPTLFSHFENRDGVAIQVYADQCRAEVPIKKMEDDAVEAEKQAFIRVFDIERGPLYRAEVLDTPSGVVLFMDFHHLVYDGASLNILMNEICSAIEGTEPTPEPRPYAEFAEAQQTSTSEHKAYYDKLLGSGITSTQLPADLGGENGIHKECTQFVSVPDVMSKAKALGTAPSALFMAAAFYTLSRFTNSKELCMTTISNGRLNPLSEGVVGMFVNTLPLVCRIEDMNVSEFIHGIRSMFQETRKHEEYSFAAISNDYGLVQQIRFTYQYGTLGNTYHIQGEEVKAEPMRVNSPTLPLTIIIHNIGGKPAIVINYDSAKYSSGLVSRFAESMDAVISHFLAEPEARLQTISIMSERQETEVSALRQTCLDPSAVRFPLFHNSLEYWAEQTPDKTALIACNETLTYRQLNEKANMLAHALINKGVMPGDRVCLLLPRKSWHIIAMFGVMKAGAAYIPCDPEYPAERINLITEDSHARFVITTKDKMDDYGERALDVEALLVEDMPMSNPGIEQDSETLAYLIYTSGSTGRPKGVMLKHIGICNYLTPHKENRHIHAFVNECTSMMGITTVSFDLSLKELGATLYNGKSLVFANEEEIMSPALMTELYRRTGCDGFNGTPSRLKAFLELQEFQEAMKDVKVIILGGEKYPAALIPQLRSITSARLFNTYGPTEITVSSNVGELTNEDRVTVGEPLLNYHEYIVDADNNELPVGVMGELLIGGIGVGGGYNDLPEKTAEAFVQYHGQRVYRSGDYARWTDNGKVEILGRKDHQIKLNGLRIELGEVETVLNRQPQVKEGVVMIKNVEGHDHLVAYFVPADVAETSTQVDTDVIKEQMGKSLTHYMVPTIFVQMDKMPISPNGKTDLKALPEPVINMSDSEKVMPTTAEEQSLYDVVAEIVGNTNFGISTNLISVGLTSLLAIRLSVFVNSKMNAALSVRDILRYPTIKELATKLKTNEIPQESTNDSQQLTSASLSFSQLGIYSECMSNPEDIQYNIPVCIHMPQGVTPLQVKDAVKKVLEVHPYIYTHFQSDDNGDAYQCSMEKKDIDITILTKTDEELEQERKDFVRPFALQDGPLFHLEVVEAPSGVYLLADFHHLIMDGGSLDIFYRQLCQSIDGQPLMPENYNYYQFVGDQKIEKSTEQFFAEQLGQIEEASALIPDKYVNDESHHQGEIKIPTDLKGAQGKCKRLNITPASLYLAAVTIAVSKYTFEDTVGICTVSNGRSTPRISGTFGMFVNTLPLVCNVDSAMSVDEYLKKTADTFMETLAHEDYPYGKIVENYGYMANIMYAYQVGVLNKYHCKNGELKIQKLELQKAKFPLSVLIEGDMEQGFIRIQYDESSFSDFMMKGFASAVQHIATELLTCEKVCDVSLCDEQMTSILDSFNIKNNPVSADEDADQTVLSLFQRTARQYPDNIAAVYKEKKYTYRELDELTDRIGEYIYNKVLRQTQQSGYTRKEPVVSILIPRNEYVFILPLAVMKAGCAYQPLDPSYPQERLNFMVKDADAAMLIADDELSSIINEYDGDVVLTSELTTLNSQLSTLNSQLSTLTPQSLFILLYTSGSTGVPKGVMLEHQNLVAFIKFYRKYYDLKPEHNVAAYASFGFDANMMDLYPALTTGATVHIIPEEIRLDLVAINDYFETNGITHGFFTTQVGVQFLQNTENHSLRHLSVGGEKLVSVDPAMGYTFHNLYGPTECTVFATITPVLKKEPNIPIGKPTDLVNCYVMDKNQHRLPVGAAGELIIVGKQVGRGYLNRPDKTAEAFFVMDGERAYHTGDIVRYRQDGNIEFVGRKDGQVKIRGFRIELKEVEAVIREYKGINDVTVQAFDDPNGGKFIAAYVVSDEALNIDDLNKFILEQKPPYMVPAVTMQIEKIPLNVNQKVDKKALPKPKLRATTAEGNAPTAPLNALETELKAIIASVVNTEDFTITDVLGFIGLTSISSIKLATLIYMKYGVQVNSKTLVKAGSLQSIENAILEMWMKGETKKVAKVKNDDHSNDDVKDDDMTNGQSAPLTYPQAGVYFDCLKNPGTTLYNVPIQLTFSGNNITVEELIEAVKATVDNHQSFRLIFGIEEGEVRQSLVKNMPVEISVKEMSEDDIDAYKHDFIRPFNLTQGPLFRFDILKTDSNLHLFMDIHHLVIDGGSIDVIAKEISARLNGEEVYREDYSYLQFAADQKAAKGGEEYLAAKSFFDSRLANCEGASEITSDKPKDDTASHTIGYCMCAVDMTPVEHLARRLGVTPMSVFLAAAYYTVSRFVNNKQIYLGTISNGRSNLRTYNTTGMFVNTLALSSEINDQTVSGFIQETDQNFSDTINHEQYPFAQIAADYGFRPEIIFEYQVGVLTDNIVRGEKALLKGLSLDLAKFKIKFVINSTPDGGHVIKIGYDEAFYTPELADSLAESMSAVVEHFISNPDALIKTVSIMSGRQETEVSSLRQTCLDPSAVRFPLFHNSLEYWAEQTPDKTALIACNETLTYRQLNEKANMLAHALISKGVMPGDRVCLLLPRKSWHIIAMFGVMKAGAAYIPCDPEYPAERINLITEDSHARFVITTKDKMDDYGERALDVEALLAEDMPMSNPGIEQDSETLAYLIYTSGSTGRPKGVMLKHIGICNYLTDHPENRHFHALVNDCKTMLCITTVSFDLSLKEIGASLFNGMTLVFADEEQVNDPQALADLMSSTEVDGFSGTPSRLKMFLDLPDFQKAFAKCKFIVLGGEKYPPSLLPQIKELAPNARLFNTYGPTEISVSSNGKELTHEEHITIGRPLLNVKEYVVDNDLNELPVGVTGELLIGGLGVAAGYNDLPEKTDEAFIEFNGERCYKSGDYAYWNQEGDIIILGRKDHQIKLNGLRIELGEVETVLNRQPQVKEGVVMIKNVEGHDHLVAYFVPVNGAEESASVGTDVIKEQMGKSLTHYMVPTIFVQMDKMPISPNGKTDLKALPEPTMANRKYVEPANDVERFFADTFANILARERVGATDNFFEIGGTSLVAIRVVMAAMQNGYKIVYKQVFDNPTPRALAALQGAASVTSAPSESNIPSASSEAEVVNDGTDPEVQDYDYLAINELLKKNNLSSLHKEPMRPLGTCIVTGATGYLGIHVVKELIDNIDVPAIYCLVRSNKRQNAESRFRTQLFYYFGTTFEDLFGSRIFVIDGDITKPDCLDAIPTASLHGQMTVFNCAANVKHFSVGTDIEEINIGGCQTCIDFCLKTGARLIQTSTHSIAGTKESNQPCQPDNISESRLYWGQKLGNQYAHAKFIAERNVLEAIANKGLDGKIMRLGNLSARSTDGEFQINFTTNSFMGRLKAFQTIGCMPYQMAQRSIEFSPINEVAKAVVVLATTPKDCTVFHPVNAQRQLFDNIIVCMNRLGIKIDLVENDKYSQALNNAFSDPAKAPILQSLMAYQAEAGKYVVSNGDNYEYTTQSLLRLGFRWNFTSWDYMEQFIAAIQGLGFFDEDYQR